MPIPYVNDPTVGGEEELIKCYAVPTTHNKGIILNNRVYDNV